MASNYCQHCIDRPAVTTGDFEGRTFRLCRICARELEEKGSLNTSKIAPRLNHERRMRVGRLIRSYEE